ncbi:hypothetical protein QC762_208715 [Podospora pseudocomata]|uniref:FAD-binding FR-type domain-containing protein n=1 Tax=Podospora pseudocomata TaxID=2093779 RepID=A0ABR0GMI5_9PEZI|nr:hypothetical protein QC762_208715 [Podospora pseudocomata]
MIPTDKTTHIDRTAHEPRDNSLHELLITTITPITPTIRLFHLTPSQPSQPPISFLPGQWVDLYYPPFPSCQKPGGFTITSPPSHPHMELAIQQSPLNPPAAYLWQDPSTLLHTPVRIRIGGSFTYPPQIFSRPSEQQPLLSSPSSSSTPPGFKKLVLVAGGVGINPLISILSHISTTRPQPEITLLYSLKDPNSKIQSGDTSQALFLDRIINLFSNQNDPLKGNIKLFLTTTGGPNNTNNISTNEITTKHLSIPFEKRRISLSDVSNAIGEHKDDVAVYICGVPSMTDQFVDGLTSPSPQGLGIDKSRVLCEKWW